MARRRLSDLYQVGKEIIIDDGELVVDEETGEEVPDPIVVYLRKLTLADQEKALRRANAARSASLALRTKPDSDEYRARFAEADAMDRDTKIMNLIADDLIKARQSMAAEIAEEEDSEWAEDGYLEGLRDAWEDELSRVWAENPEDPEAKRVYEELQRYEAEVVKFLDGQKASLAAQFERTSEDELTKQVVKKLFEMDAESAWYREFKRCQLWLAVRDPDDHKKLYFEDREEVDDLPMEVLTRLNREYEAMTVVTAEGKGSPAPASSSEPSESGETQETDTDSGQKAITA